MSSSSDDDGSGGGDSIQIVADTSTQTEEKQPAVEQTHIRGQGRRGRGLCSARGRGARGGMLGRSYGSPTRSQQTTKQKKDAATKDGSPMKSVTIKLTDDDSSDDDDDDDDDSDSDSDYEISDSSESSSISSSSESDSESEEDSEEKAKRKEERKKKRKEKRLAKRRKQRKKMKAKQKKKNGEDDSDIEGRGGSGSEDGNNEDGEEDEDDYTDDEEDEEWGPRKTLFKDTLEKGRFWLVRGRPGRLSHRKLCWCVLDREAYQVRCYNMGMKVVSCIDLRLAKEPERCEAVKKGRYPVVFSSEHTRKSFTLEAETEEQRDMLYERAQEVVRNMDPPDQEMIRMFLEADRDGSFTLEFNEVKNLLKKRGIQISVSAMRDKFDEVDGDRNGSLDFAEFERLENIIRYDKDIEKVFKRYAGRDMRYMSRANFTKFLHTAQGDFPDEKYLDDLIAKYNPAKREEAAAAASDAAKKRKSTRKSVRKSTLTLGDGFQEDDEETLRRTGLDIRGFVAFLRSAEDNPALRRDTPSLDRPLAQYLISACANPCLENDWAGATPLKTLDAAIAANCRYYELSALSKGDSVAFGVKGALSVGVTETLIKLKELLRRDPTMPLVISLDVVGCSKAEQEALLMDIDTTFGDRLATTITTAKGTKDGSKEGPKLVTPESLAGKAVFLMREKALEVGVSEEKEAAAAAAASDDIGLDIASLARMNSGTMGDKLYGQLLLGAKEQPGQEQQQQQHQKKRKKERYLVPPDDPADEWGEDDRGIVPALGKFAGLVGVTFLGVEKSKHPEFKNAASGSPVNNVISLKPAKAQLFGNPTNAALLRNYCGRRLARLRNPPTSVDAPFPLIGGGAQITPASFAQRRHGLPPATIIAREYFCGRGMVPKPAWLNTAHGVPPAIEAVTLRLTIINARQLPKVGREAAVDPYVTAVVLGFDKDSSPCANPYVPKSEAFVSEATNKSGVPLAELATRVNKKEQTQTIKNNGWDPSWNATFEFTLYAPALDALVLTVKDKDFGPDDFIGFTVLPCNLINKGYHTLKLFDYFGNELPFAYLFCHFAIIPVVTSIKTTFTIVPEQHIAVPTYADSLSQSQQVPPGYSLSQSQQIPPRQSIYALNQQQNPRQSILAQKQQQNPRQSMLAQKKQQNPKQSVLASKQQIPSLKMTLKQQGLQNDGNDAKDPSSKKLQSPREHRKSSKSPVSPREHRKSSKSPVSPREQRKSMKPPVSPREQRKSMKPPVSPREQRKSIKPPVPQKDLASGPSKAPQGRMLSMTQFAPRQPSSQFPLNRPLPFKKPLQSKTTDPKPKPKN